MSFKEILKEYIDAKIDYEVSRHLEIYHSGSGTNAEHERCEKAETALFAPAKIETVFERMGIDSESWLKESRELMSRFNPQVDIMEND